MDECMKRGILSAYLNGRSAKDAVNIKSVTKTQKEICTSEALSLCIKKDESKKSHLQGFCCN